jgi:hypothetical protein
MNKNNSNCGAPGTPKRRQFIFEDLPADKIFYLARCFRHLKIIYNAAHRAD